MKNHLYKILGFFTLILAYIGIITPGIPGIPFLLFTAYFFFNSSEKRYNWLINHKVLGKIIKKHSGENGLSMKAKLLVISQFWGSIIIALIWFVSNVFVGIILVLFGVLMSVLFFRFAKFKF